MSTQSQLCKQRENEIRVCLELCVYCDSVYTGIAAGEWLESGEEACKNSTHTQYEIHVLHTFIVYTNRKESVWSI